MESSIEQGNLLRYKILRKETFFSVLGITYRDISSFVITDLRILRMSEEQNDDKYNIQNFVVIFCFCGNV
jgi:hypothetical protein